MTQRCPDCDSLHERAGFDAPRWDGVTWEGYRKCSALDVPDDTRWDLAAHSSKTHEVYFGGPSASSEPHSWGAPLRRVIRRSDGDVEWARYHRTRKAPKESHDD